MSIIGIHDLCRAIECDPALRQTLLEDPQSELRKYSSVLTPAERTALLSGDVRTLYEMGAEDNLLRRLARYKPFGLDMKIYSERMRSCGAFEVMNILVR
jgi:hypothetical protein